MLEMGVNALERPSSLRSSGGRGFHQVLVAHAQMSVPAGGSNTKQETVAINV